MKIGGCHSHLNGLEFVKVHKPALWDEIEHVLQSAESSTEAPGKIGAAIANSFRQHRWSEPQVAHATTETTHLSKERLGVAVHFGTREVGPYDIFAKHMASYVGDVIDVGVEILPMKELQAQVSPGAAYYEGELYKLIREGRGVPAVPLILIGVAP
jgi:hypothetical protein